MYKTKRALHIFALLALSVFFASCCGDNGRPDLRLTSQSFPASANVNQNFTLTFTVANNSTTDCPADRSTQTQVNLKMVRRGATDPQVNNFENMNALDDNQTQTFTFNVVIGPGGNGGPGTYDLTFTIDPYNNSNDAVKDNNVYTSVVIIN